MSALESPGSVVHVLWSGHVGGIERLVHDLAVVQSGRGIEVAVAFGQPEGFFADRIRDLGIEVLDLGLRSGSDLSPRKIRSGARLLRKFDVLHTHGFNLPLGAIMRRAGRPVVFTEHGQFGLGRRLGAMERLKLRMQRRFITEHCAVVAANSRWTAGLLRDRYRLAPDRVAVVHNGIEVEGLTEPEARDGPGAVIVFVGRLKAFKRVDRLIRAVAGVQEGDVRALVVGRGPLEEDLRGLASELGVADRVRFLGWLPEVAPALRQADAIVLPSEGEPFGLVLVEGCAQGLLPIVFADAGGALECIPPDGRVVGDIEELVTVLEQLEGSPSLSMDARQARAAWARQQFPITTTAGRYLELYASSLKS